MGARENRRRWKMLAAEYGVDMKVRGWRERIVEARALSEPLDDLVSAQPLIHWTDEHKAK